MKAELQELNWQGIRPVIIIDELQALDFLYYNPTMAEYKLQGRSMEIGLLRYVQEIAGQGEDI